MHFSPLDCWWQKKKGNFPFGSWASSRAYCRWWHRAAHEVHPGCFRAASYLPFQLRTAALRTAEGNTKCFICSSPEAAGRRVARGYRVIEWPRAIGVWVPAGSERCRQRCCCSPGSSAGSDGRRSLTSCQHLLLENTSRVQPAWPPVGVTCFAICHCQMFLYSASVTWFATHLTPCIINFASQLTRCVIIFASHFGLGVLITVSNGPRGRLQHRDGSRCRPWRPRVLPGLGGRAPGLPMWLGQLRGRAATCCFSSLTRI